MNWNQHHQRQQNKDYYKLLMDKLEKAYEHETIYPPRNQLFAALDACPYDKVKVVIIGQDPYHGEKQANGLAFSVSDEVALPPSLKNMYKELLDDVNIERTTGDLTGWATQGILLLNQVLSVTAHKPNSHEHFGWQAYTQSIIECLNDHPHNIIYVLWGRHAQKLSVHISDRHHIISGPHPSPLSAYRGFFKSKPFSQINAILQNEGRAPIDWSK
ncbi:MAG: uracil-DNA glycosylase [Erysipelothrix sp.]|nr:uracil-DNA glycosylase [Erysipelothrix sp.]